MTEIVHIQHPVPVRHVPRRARKERVEFVARTSPVRFTQAGAGEFEPLPFESRVLEEQGRELFAHRGRVWHRLSRHGPTPPSYRVPISRESFLQRLGDAGEWEDDVMRHLMRTPLVAAVYNEADLNPSARPRRGSPGAALAGARMVSDYHDAAVRGLQAFLDGEVRLVGDEVFVRCFGPLAVQSPRVAESPDLRVSIFPRGWAGAGQACALDGVEAFRAIQERHGLPLPRNLGLRGELQDPETARAIPAELRGDDDLELLALDLPRRLQGVVEIRCREGVDLRGELEPLLHHRDRLRLMAPLGQIGVLAHPLEEQLVALRDVLATLGEVQLLYNEFAFAADYIDEVALPRLRAGREADPDDGDALAGLAPGMR